jgi:hypothetical protein
MFVSSLENVIKECVKSGGTGSEQSTSGAGIRAGRKYKSSLATRLF